MLTRSHTKHKPYAVGMGPHEPLPLHEGITDGMHPSSESLSCRLHEWHTAPPSHTMKAAQVLHSPAPHRQHAALQPLPQRLHDQGWWHAGPSWALTYFLVVGETVAGANRPQASHLQAVGHQVDSPGLGNAKHILYHFY